MDPVKSLFTIPPATARPPASSQSYREELPSCMAGLTSRALPFSPFPLLSFLPLSPLCEHHTGLKFAGEAIQNHGVVLAGTADKLFLQAPSCLNCGLGQCWQTVAHLTILPDKKSQEYQAHRQSAAPVLFQQHQAVGGLHGILSITVIHYIYISLRFC